MMQTVKVLLIEDDPDYAALVQSWLASSKEVQFETYWEPTVLAGVDRVARGGVDLILLDLSLPDSAGLETFRIVRARAKDLPIILLSGDDRESLAIDLVGSGAQDYLVKSSCSADSLCRSILFSLVRRTKSGDDDSYARIIGVVSGKGGVGVTTLAASLAIGLKRRGDGEVLLCDLDLHANGIGFVLGLNPKHTLLDSLVNTHRLDDATRSSLVTRTSDHIDVLPSPALCGAREPNPNEVRQLLNQLSLHYSWVVLDLGRLDQSSMAMLGASDQAILVTSTSLASLHETRRVISTLQSEGFETDKLSLAVSELPGVSEMSDSIIKEMTGMPVKLRLEESSAQMPRPAKNMRLPSDESEYRESVSQLAGALCGFEPEKPNTNRLREMLGWG